MAVKAKNGVPGDVPVSGWYGTPRFTADLVDRDRIKFL